MDALADPLAYLSALDNMGVDDADIAEVQPPSNSQSSRSLNDVLRE